MSEENTFQMDPEQMRNPELCREIGKRLYFDKQASLEDRNYGLALLDRAVALKDDEARYIIGFLLVSGAIQCKTSDSIEYGLSLLCISADHGFMPARNLLNRYTDERYQRDILSRQEPSDSYIGPLKDFDGKIIKINRTGALTPIDAVLDHINGCLLYTSLSPRDRG